MKTKTMFVLALALGLGVMVGCGDGGSNVPRSEPTYTGAGLPAVLDSTTGTQNLYGEFLASVNGLAMQFGGSPVLTSLGTTSSSTSDFVEGGDGGSYTYAGSFTSTWSDTSLYTSVMQSLTFNDFADSAGVLISYAEGGVANGRIDALGLGASPLAAVFGYLYFPELQAGRGALYRSASSTRTTDGIPVTVPQVIGPVGPGPVGSPLTDDSAYYVNHDAFFTSQGHPFDGYQEWWRRTLLSGFISSNMNAARDSATSYWSFRDVISADYAMDYFYSSSITPSSQYTRALLGFGQTHAWDLSTSTFVSSGRYCAEGDVPTGPAGCLDFDVSLTWDDDASGLPSSCRYWSDLFACYGWPDDGWITLEAGGATASFAFTTGGGTFTFDAGDGSAVYQTTLATPF
ncbi:MAG: hypothetical protein JSV00_01610 [bacterium]|nr:MAG: hypothetical protein JSV00_01610 [bacterium]